MPAGRRSSRCRAAVADASGSGPEAERLGLLGKGEPALLGRSQLGTDDGQLLSHARQGDVVAPGARQLGLERRLAILQAEQLRLGPAQQVAERAGRAAGACARRSGAAAGLATTP